MKHINNPLYIQQGVLIMIVTNVTEIVRMLEERKDRLKAKVKNPPTNPNLLDAHERIEQNVNSYIMDINDVLSMFGYSEYDIVLVDKKGLEKEQQAADWYDFDSGDFVEIWKVSRYNEKSDTSYFYYAIYCTPMSTL